MIVMDKFMWASVSAILLLTTIFVYLASSVVAGEAHAAEVTVYKSPTCGCCKKWVNHLEKNGFDVKAKNRKDLSSIKKQYGIGLKQQSCHTALVDGYVIEGHVPASDVERLLAEKPDIRGLTVPGMVMGSPGMEGHRKDHYKVLAIDHQGQTSVYAEY